MIINDLPYIMCKCLILTIIIETIVALIIGIRNKKDILNIILVNILTNPLVTSIPVYFNIKYGVLERDIALIILEVFTVIIEGIIYIKFLKFKKINSILISIYLNACSYFIGEIVNFIL